MEQKKWAFRLSLTAFFFYFCMSGQSYLTVYLKSIGYSVTQVSLINALIFVAAIISTPLGGRIADKMHSSRKALFIGLLCWATCFFLAPISRNLTIIGVNVSVIAIIAGRFFQGPTKALIDPTLITLSNNNHTSFGSVRIWGTISYVLMCFLLGYIIKDDTSYLNFYITACCLIPTALCFLSLKKLDNDEQIIRKEEPKSDKEALKTLLTSPYFILYVIFIVLEKVPHNCVNTYMAYMIEIVGGPMSFIGYIAGYKAAFEIPALLLSDRLQKKMTFRQMVIVSALLQGIQCVLYWRVHDFTSLLLATTLAGIGSGFSIAGSFKYVFVLSPKQAKSTAQTVVGAMENAAGIASNLLGAWMITLFGIRTFYLIIGSCLIASVIMFVVGNHLIEKVWKVPFIDYTKIEE